MSPPFARRATRLGLHAALAAAAAILASASPASAAEATFRVVEATHRSSSERTTDGYHGRSTVRWSLAGATREHDNRLRLSRLGTTLSGLGSLNVRGVYRLDAGRCVMRAATGSARYPMAAPAPFQLTLGPEPGNPSHTVLSFAAVQASLVNAYTPSECRTSVAGEPRAEVTSMKRLAPRVLRRDRFAVRFHGATEADGLRYRWRTVIAFARVER